MPQNHLHRRDFLRRSALSGAALWVAGSRPGLLAASANEKLNIGIIGTAHRAAANINGVQGENIVALCDIDEPTARPRRANDSRRRRPSTTSASCWTRQGHRRRGRQHRRPHPRPGRPIGAMQARQARLLREAADPLRPRGPRRRRGRRRPGRGDADGHADPRHRQLPPRRRADPVRRHRPGPRGPRLGAARAGAAATGPTRLPPVPPYLDWDLWLGPAPKRPYHPVYQPANWRRWWDFGNGTLGDMGCHSWTWPSGRWT